MSAIPIPSIVTTSPDESPSVIKHWATVLSPSPSPIDGSPTSSLGSRSSSAGPRFSPSLSSSLSPRARVSLPPLRTAVPLARLDTYRRGSDKSLSPIQEMLFRRSPLSATSHSPIKGSPYHKANYPLVQNPNNPNKAGWNPASPFAFAPPDHDGGMVDLKSPRKRADQSQLAVLNRAFAGTQYPSTEERDRLSRKLGMTSRSVQIWFQNRRRAVKVHDESAKERFVRELC